MPNKTFVFGVTVIAVLIIVGGVSWTLFNSNQATAPTSDNSQNPQNSQNSQNSQTPQNPTNSTENQNTENSSASNSTNTDASGTPDLTGITIIVPENVRDAAMAYIKTAYPKTAQYISNFTWSGGRSEAESSENETYLYYASNWVVKVQWAPVSNPTVRLSISYSSEATMIAWEGTYLNGAIKQTSYSST